MWPVRAQSRCRCGRGEPIPGAHAIAFQPGAGQGSPWVRPCSPPSERCRGGKITDSPPFIRAAGANGCADQYAGAPSGARMRWCWGAPHRTRSVCAGPYCSACAEGFFEKGKLCAPCDPGTKDVMCAEHSRAAPPRYIGRCAFGILLQVGHHVRLYRALRGRHFLLPSQHGLCYIRFHGRAFLPSCVMHMMAGACACTHDRPCTLVGTHASQCEPVPTPPCGASSRVNLRSTKVAECRFRNLD